IYLSTLSPTTSSSILPLLTPIIEADLTYVQTHWNQTGFDLWEEVRGSSYFTSAVQYRALVEGAAYFKSVGMEKPTWTTTADAVLCFLQSYWSEKDGWVVSNVGAQEKRSGLDGNTILASIHTFDSDSTNCDSQTLQPCSDRALANHKAVVDSFRGLYAINKGYSAGEAVAVGRYSEDVYYGGQPWYLITLAAAEQLYDALYTWKKSGSISITSVSLPFFTAIYQKASVGTYSKESETYRDVMQAVENYADGFFSIVEKYTPADGAMAEQFHGTTGEPLSATDLTWSYASFVTAAAARRGEVPKGWNSAGSGVAACSGAKSSTTVQVTFDEVVSTVYGESILVAGSLPELGSWDPEAARSLNAAQYTAQNHLWSRSLYLPPATTFEYKFIRKDGEGNIKWESGPNRYFAIYSKLDIIENDLELFAGPSRPPTRATARESTPAGNEESSRQISTYTTHMK
ncbi:glucoamylase, partial [Phenoliferia sp. Uapishka_3]